MGTLARVVQACQTQYKYNMYNTGQIGLADTKYSNLPAQLSRISLAMGNVEQSHLTSPELTDWVFMTT